jgi:hypothetical protein
MKSVFLELMPVDPGLDKFSVEIKKIYQIVPDEKIIDKIKRETFENRSNGKEYQIFQNNHWLISGKMDDEDLQSIWVEIFKK